MKTNSTLLTVYAPKTAGASSISINLAMLYQKQHPQLKVAFIEVSPFHSLKTCLAPGFTHNWGHLMPFYQTQEWEKTLLERLSCDLGLSIFWTPQGDDFPVFSASSAKAMLDLFKSQFDVIFLDLNQSSTEAWQQFWLQQSQQILVVTTPDPLSVEACKRWLAQQNTSMERSIVVNQASARELSLMAPALEPYSIQGTIRSDRAAFWQQHYQAFPVAWQRGKAFKDLSAITHGLNL